MYSNCSLLRRRSLGSGVTQDDCLSSPESVLVEGYTLRTVAIETHSTCLQPENEAIYTAESVGTVWLSVVTWCKGCVGKTACQSLSKSAGSLISILTFWQCFRGGEQYFTSIQETNICQRLLVVFNLFIPNHRSDYIMLCSL